METQTKTDTTLKISNIWENLDELINRLRNHTDTNKAFADYLIDEIHQNTLNERSFINAIFLNPGFVDVLDYDETYIKKFKKNVKSNDLSFKQTLIKNLDGQHYNGILFDKFYELKNKVIDVNNRGEQDIEHHTLEVQKDIEFGNLLVTCDYSETLVYNSEGIYQGVHERYNQKYFDDVYSNVTIETKNINLIEDAIFKNDGFTFIIKNCESFSFELVAFYCDGKWNFGRIDNLLIDRPNNFNLDLKIINKLLIQLYRFDKDLLFNYVPLKFNGLSINLSKIKNKKNQIKVNIENIKNNLYFNYNVIKPGNYFESCNNQETIKYDSYEYADTSHDLINFLDNNGQQLSKFIESELKYVRLR